MDQTVLEELVARQKIQDCLTRYARGIDRMDFELAKSSYHPDGYDDHGPAKGNAHEVMDAVAAFMKGRVEAFQHRVSNTLIELHGKKAHVESYFYSIQFNLGADIEEHVYGRYIDVFEERDGDWKILTRKVVVDMTTCPPRGERFSSEDKFFRGKFDETDPSYDLFERVAT